MPKKRNVGNLRSFTTVLWTVKALIFGSSQMIQISRLLVLLAVSPLAAFAQGTVNFTNLDPAVGLNAPVYMWDETSKLYGSMWAVELWAGQRLDQLFPVASSSFQYSAGYFNGGVVAVPYPPGTQTWLVVRAFWSSQGSYENARREGSLGTWGESGPIQVSLGGGALPAPMLGLTSFSMYPDDPDILGWRPRLVLKVAQTGVLALDWDKNYWEYLLQQNPDLNPQHWVTVTNQPELYGSFLRVTLSQPRGRMFFRLAK